MSEIAIVTARKARLSKMASEGSRSAAIALKLGENPTHFLSAVQIGITSIGLLNVTRQVQINQLRYFLMEDTMRRIKLRHFGQIFVGNTR